MILEDLSTFFNTIDYSEELNDFLDEEVNITATSSDYIYMGLHKPFNQIYVYMSTPSATKVSFNVEYFNGSGWTQVQQLTDDTKKFTRSGFIFWQEADLNTEIEETTINSVEKYFYRISFNSNITITLKGLNIIFSQDRDIFQSRPFLDDSEYRRAVVKNETDYMKVHLDVVDLMIQDLRNMGIKKYQGQNEIERLKFIRNITKWDLFDIDEIKVSCKFLALSNIYYSLSDSDDKYESEAERFKEEYYRTLNIAFISIDKDNDGRLESNENLKPIKTSTMSR